MMALRECLPLEQLWLGVFVVVEVWALVVIVVPVFFIFYTFKYGVFATTGVCKDYFVGTVFFSSAHEISIMYVVYELLGFEFWVEAF